MKLAPGIAIMKSIWKIQVKVVKSVSIPRYQHSKFQILDILPLWKPKKMINLNLENFYSNQLATKLKSLRADYSWTNLF